MRPAPRLLSTLVLPCLLGLASTASADDASPLKFDFSGRIQTDLRFRTAPVGIGHFYDRVELPAGVERNQNLLKLKAKASYGRFTALGDIDFVVLGTTGKLEGLTDLTKTQASQPYRFDVNQLYIEAKDLFFKGLDMRVGQQIVAWGVGDQFNPTNNLNPNDLRDPLLFGKQAGNFMVKLDYWLTDTWSLSGVLVPLYRPALLPDSAALGVAAIDRLPFTSDVIRHRIEAEAGFSASSIVGKPTVVNTITPVLPPASFDNMQLAFRIAGSIAEQDVALSYYVGRTDFPQPFANHTHEGSAPSPFACNPSNPTQCDVGRLLTDVSLGFPRMHVYGLNVTGEIPLSWASKTTHGIGYRFEGAIVVPETYPLKLTQEDLNLGGITKSAGEYDYPGGKKPNSVDGTAFAKWVLGLDYAFGSHVYVNAQWVHGLLDEFGTGYAVRASGVTTSGSDTLTQCVVPADGKTCAAEILRPRIGNYAVAGVDLKFANDAALLRLFSILDLTPLTDDFYDAKQAKRVQVTHSPFTREAFSMVIYPDFNYNFGNGLELGGGSLIQLGRVTTKFGDPAGGGNIVFGRARFSY